MSLFRFYFRIMYCNIMNILEYYNINNINKNINNVFYNLGYDDIFELEKEETGILTNLNTICIKTGKYTGRSPKDKYFVDDNISRNNLWWGNINKSITIEIFNDLYRLIQNHYNNSKYIYIYDGFVGCDKTSRKKVRFITEYVWQHHFVKNMFIEATKNELKQFENNDNIDFTIINACNVVNNNYINNNMNSSTFVAFSLEKKIGLIGGTHYGGEMKKGIFSLMNYWLPLNNILSMHCSANIDNMGKTALFFGLSGTGKTTLSTDENRKLIGDDEHGWNDNGIFNLEGGCYAKTSDLTYENEPEIYSAIKKNALLENVYLNSKNDVDFNNKTITENGRVSYPLYHIKNRKTDSLGNHPKNIFLLCCDGFSILPPIAKLTHEQAIYYFLTGYTSKISGTECGIIEPQFTFSACFGEAFLTLHPLRYAELFKDKIDKHDCNVYLINTGWSGGVYGIGKRIQLDITRGCINSVFDGSINNYGYYNLENFNFKVPKQLSFIENDSEILYPIKTWKDKNEFINTKNRVIHMFIKNYEKYKIDTFTDYSIYGPNP